MVSTDAAGVQLADEKHFSDNSIGADLLSNPNNAPACTGENRSRSPQDLVNIGVTRVGGSDEKDPAHLSSRLGTTLDFGASRNTGAITGTEPGDADSSGLINSAGSAEGVLAGARRESSHNTDDGSPESYGASKTPPDPEPSANAITGVPSTAVDADDMVWAVPGVTVLTSQDAPVAIPATIDNILANLAEQLELLADQTTSLDSLTCRLVAEQLAVLLRRGESVHVQIVGRAGNRGEWSTDSGYRSATTWLAATQLCSSGAARGMLANDRWLQTNELFARAFAQGEVSGAHVSVMRRCVTEKPWRQEAFAQFEEYFVDAARKVNPQLLGRLVRSWAERLDDLIWGDDARTSTNALAVQHELRSARWWQVGDMWEFQACLPAIDGALLAGVLNQIVEEDRRRTCTCRRASCNCVTDGRSITQRRADAVAALTQLLRASPRSQSKSDQTASADAQPILPNTAGPAETGMAGSEPAPPEPPATFRGTGRNQPSDSHRRSHPEQTNVDPRPSQKPDASLRCRPANPTQARGADATQEINVPTGTRDSGGIKAADGVATVHPNVTVEGAATTNSNTPSRRVAESHGVEPTNRGTPTHGDEPTSGSAPTHGADGIDASYIGSATDENGENETFTLIGATIHTYGEPAITEEGSVLTEEGNVLSEGGNVLAQERDLLVQGGNGLTQERDLLVQEGNVLAEDELSIATGVKAHANCGDPRSYGVQNSAVVVHPHAVGTGVNHDARSGCVIDQVQHMQQTTDFGHASGVESIVTNRDALPEPTLSNLDRTKVLLLIRLEDLIGVQHSDNIHRHETGDEAGNDSADKRHPQESEVDHGDSTMALGPESANVPHAAPVLTDLHRDWDFTGLAANEISVRLRALSSQWITGNGAGTGFMPRAAAMTELCDTVVQRVILGPDSRPLDIGRKTRIVPPDIRSALIARDRGCIIGDCDIPPAWCHAHHIQHWSQGGATALHNLALTCDHHHAQLHAGRWFITMDGHGRPVAHQQANQPSRTRSTF